MSLRAIAQLQALACILAYVRFLYAPTWRVRALYGLLTIIFLATVIITLQNSWWLEIGVALVILSVIYSWRLVVFYLFALVPFMPIMKAELDKLQSVKQVDSIRFIIWQDSLRVWMKQRVLGVGPGNFWVYDQVFTNLPRALRNCNTTGLCVSHNGYLQVLGELGPLGLFFFIAFPVLMIVLAAMLYRRSPVRGKRSKGNRFFTFARWIGLDLADVPEKQVSKPKQGSWNSGIHAFLYDDRSGKSEPRKGFWRSVVRAFLDDDRSEKHINRMLALAIIGLTAGSMVADFFAGGFFIPPRQISVLTELPQVVTSWIMWGLLMYRDQQWIAACKKAKATLMRPSLYLRKLYPTLYTKRSW
jgi:hypothetical protein